MSKIEILIKPISEFGKLNIVGIHSLEPSYSKILDLIADAEKDGFKVIVIYTKRGFGVRSNIFKNSTWTRLIKDFENVYDVRAGMISRRYGQCLGDGFTMWAV